jgi:hypothetical protein
MRRIATRATISIDFALLLAAGAGPALSRYAGTPSEPLDLSQQEAGPSLYNRVVAD